MMRNSEHQEEKDEPKTSKPNYLPTSSDMLHHEGQTKVVGSSETVSSEPHYFPPTASSMLHNEGATKSLSGGKNIIKNQRNLIKNQRDY